MDATRSSRRALTGTLPPSFRVSSVQVPLEEGEDLLPAVYGGLDVVVILPVGGEEPVPRLGVLKQLEVLAVAGERLGDQLGVGRRGVRVMAAEHPEHRAAEVACQVQQRLEPQRNLLRRLVGDERAVAVHRGVQQQRARAEEGLPAARAVADDADLAVTAVRRTQEVERARKVAD